MILDHPGQKRKLRLAAHHGNCTPPRISPSCPVWDRSTNAGAVIARQIGHDLLSGRLDPLPTLLAAFMQIPAQVDPRAPSNVAAHSLSLQGTPTDVFSSLDIYFRRFRKRYTLFITIPFLQVSQDFFSKTSHKIQKHFQLRQYFFMLSADTCLGLIDSFCVFRIT